MMPDWVSAKLSRAPVPMRTTVNARLSSSAEGDAHGRLPPMRQDRYLAHT